MKKAWFILSCFLLILCAASCFADQTVYENTLHNPVFGGKNDEWVGDHLYLGSYEQDNNIKNGKEPILWRVLQVDGSRALLLSEYALDIKAYHEVFTDVTWETCTLRAWLNNEFLQNALGDYDQWKADFILETTCATPPHQRYGTDGGSTTVDRIFLLAWEDTYNESYGFAKSVTRESEFTDHETMEYAPMSRTRFCYPTTYAAHQNMLLTRSHHVRKDGDASFDAFGTGYWLLRTPAKTQKYITNISRWGRSTYDFDSCVDHTEACVRPALWVDLSQVPLVMLSDGYYYVGGHQYEKKVADALNYEDEIKAALSADGDHRVLKVENHSDTSDEAISNPEYGGNLLGEWIGDRVYFGTWEGEPILWRVLEVTEDRALLLSEFSLFSMSYSTSGDVTWESSLPRQYLNSTFLNTAFTKKQRKAIPSVTLQNGINDRYQTDSGPQTKDKIFLLTNEDVCNPSYGFTEGDDRYNGGATYSNSRICYERSVTSTMLHGLDVSSKYALYDPDGNAIYNNTKYAVSWWTRTAGFDNKHVCDANIYGDVYLHEQIKSSKKLGIRPAMYVDLTKLTLVLREDSAFLFLATKK